ncbi:MAG: DUF4329 domain-containing protein [Pyrinomonadaceae bacterium]
MLKALGYNTAAKILGWIAIATAVGAGIANLLASKVNTSLIIKNIASTAEQTIPIWQRILSAISSVGAVANAFAKGKPRKTFKTAQQVAIDFLKIYNPISIRRNREIAAVICRLRRNVYIYGRPQVLGPLGGTRTNDCPANSQLAGGVHAHARHDASLVGPFGDGNEVFSGTDVNTSNSSGLSEWIATPSGEIRRYNPWDGSVATISRLPGVGRTRRR